MGVNQLIKEIDARIRGNVNGDSFFKLLNSGKLIPGKKYTIDNYQTITNLFNGSTPLDEVYFEGPVETLVVTALTENSISPIAFSPRFPYDLIHYDPYSVVTEDGITPRLGKITKRINTSNNCGAEKYDFRNVKFRRWAIDVDAIEVWTDKAYPINTLVNKDGFIAVSRKEISDLSGESPDFPSNYWFLLFNLNDESKYQSWKNDSFFIGRDFPGYLRVEIPVDADDYVDYYTFSAGLLEGSGGVFDTVIGPTLPGEIYNNIVFQAAVGEMPSDNNFESCGFSTIGFAFKRNKIGPLFSNNIIAHIFQDNVVENNFHHNLAKGEVTSNQIGPYCQENFFDKLFYDNVIASYYNGNFTGDHTEDNIFGSGNGGFNTGPSMIENHFASPCKVVADAGFANNMLYGATNVTCHQDECKKITVHGTITVDLSNSTHAIGDYTKEIVKIEGGGIRIRYTSSTGVVTTVLTTV